MQFPLGLNPGTDNIFSISVNFIKDLILLLVLQFSDIHDYTTLHYITLHYMAGLYKNY